MITEKAAKSDSHSMDFPVSWDELHCHAWTLATMGFGVMGAWRALGQKAAPLLRND